MQQRIRTGKLSFPSPYPFYGHISINNDKTGKNEGEWDVIIGCYGELHFINLPSVTVFDV